MGGAVAPVHIRRLLAELAAETSPDAIAGAANKAGAVAKAEYPYKAALQDNAAGNKNAGSSGDWLPKVSADEKKKAELAENMVFNINNIASILRRRPDIVGVVASRITNVQQVAGSNDDVAKQQQTPPSGQRTDDASNTRQMLVSALTGMPTPNMTAQDKASFERGKSAGAVSVPLAAGVTAGAMAAPELAGTAERFLQISEKALEHLGENYPQLTKLAAKLGYGAGAAGAYKLLNKLGLH